MCDNKFDAWTNADLVSCGAMHAISKADAIRQNDMLRYAISGGVDCGPGMDLRSLQVSPITSCAIKPAPQCNTAHTQHLQFPTVQKAVFMESTKRTGLPFLGCE